MAVLSPRDTARLITRLGRELATRITSLGPRQMNAYLRLLAVDSSPEVVSAVNSYLQLAKRAAKHPDPFVLDAFQKADDTLAQYLPKLDAAERVLLEQEHAQRRAALLLGDAELEVLAKKERRRVAARLASQERLLVDHGAALLQGRFHDLVRGAAALPAAARTARQHLLLSAYGKLTSVIGEEWADGWGPAFVYLSRWADDIAPHARQLLAAREAREKALAAGDTTAALLARQAETAARQRAVGYLSKVKGLLGEGYVPRWRHWRLLRMGYQEIADRAAARMPGKWVARTFVGDLRLGTEEVWDEAILLIGGRTREVRARLFLASQYKWEKRVTALNQIPNDALRETAPGASTALPFLSYTGPDGAQGWFLEPMGVGEPSHRYLFNAAGGAISGPDIARLRATGLHVEQLTLDITMAESDAVIDALLETVLNVVK